MSTDALPLFEQWKPVVGYECRYEVSDLGRVWSAKNRKLLRPAPTSKGYLSVQLYDGSSPKCPRAYCVHDLVAAAFIGPKPPGYQIDHIDTDKRNNAHWNLEYVTNHENMLGAMRNGLNRPPPSNGKHPNAKLTDDQVRMLRRKWRKGRPDITRIFAEQLGVSKSTICDAASGRSYTDVT